MEQHSTRTATRLSDTLPPCVEHLSATIFRRIADDNSLPQDLRNAAQQQHDHDAGIQASLTNAHATKMVDMPLPFKGNKDFACNIYSMGNQKFDYEHDPFNTKIQLPGILLQSTINTDSDPKNIDDACRKTFDGFSATWDFYKPIFNRRSIDDEGIKIRASIYLDKGFNNAYWGPALLSMFFGDAGGDDGDGLTSLHATYDIDVIGHELTHGVVNSTAELGNEPEPGTLNEHVADCFGQMIKQRTLNQTADQADWDMASSWLSPATVQHLNLKKRYMRTFRNPDPNSRDGHSDPKHMDDVQWASDTDSHTYVGIPNHAFYLAALDFQQALGGHSWDTVGKIWYAALTDSTFKSSANQTFSGWRILTTQYAEQLFNAQGKHIIEKAWDVAGVKK